MKTFEMYLFKIITENKTFLNDILGYCQYLCQHLQFMGDIFSHYFVLFGRYIWMPTNKIVETLKFFDQIISEPNIGFLQQRTAPCGPSVWQISNPNILNSSLPPDYRIQRPISAKCICFCNGMTCCDIARARTLCYRLQNIIKKLQMICQYPKQCK